MKLYYWLLVISMGLSLLGGAILFSGGNVVLGRTCAVAGFLFVVAAVVVITRQAMRQRKKPPIT